MRYEIPELVLVGSVSFVVLGGGVKFIDRLPETDMRKGGDIEEGLDE